MGCIQRPWSNQTMSAAPISTMGCGTGLSMGHTPSSPSAALNSPVHNTEPVHEPDTTSSAGHQWYRGTHHWSPNIPSTGFPWRPLCRCPESPARSTKAWRTPVEPGAGMVVEPWLLIHRVDGRIDLGNRVVLITNSRGLKASQGHRFSHQP